MAEKPGHHDEMAQLEADYEAESQAEQAEQAGHGTTSARARSDAQEPGRDGRAAEDGKAALEPAKPKPIAFDEKGLMTGANASEEMRIARWLLSTGACPDTYKTPEQVVLGIQLVKSFGLNVMASLRYTAYINGILCIWGDLPMSIVERSGKLEYIRQYLVVKDKDGKPVEQKHDDYTMFEPAAGAVCIVKHKDKPEPTVAFYTIERAQTAGLMPGHPKSAWGKHPDRMLQVRARAMALRDAFAGELLSVAIKEYDVDGVHEAGPEKPQQLTGEINEMFEEKAHVVE